MHKGNRLLLECLLLSFSQSAILQMGIQLLLECLLVFASLSLSKWDFASVIVNTDKLQKT
jgi:hypothetical protein